MSESKTVQIDNEFVQINSLKTVQIRDMDPDLWARLKAKANIERLPVKDVLARLVRDYVNAPNEVRPA